MKNIITAFALSLGMMTSSLVHSAYPDGPVTIVVPYSPSGNTDVFVRHIAPYLEKIWGQTVLVDNKPGGGSMVGTAHVAKAEADGKTLLVTTSAFVTAPAVQTGLPFDSRKDLIPVANVGYVSYILVTNANSGFTDLKQFVAASKGNPKFAATAGLGTTTHFAIEQFAADSGAEIEVVHYKGGGPAVVSIMSGEADIYGSSVSSAGKNLKAGKIRPLAVLGNDRIKALPDVPSTKELGYPNTEIKQWVGVFAPAGTDPAIIKKVNADINSVLRNQKLIDTLTPLDWTLEQSTPAGFSKQVDVELSKWKNLAKEKGIKK